MAKRNHKGNLTDAAVQAHTFTPGRSPFLWDRGNGCCTGFAVRATPSGGLQYVIQYRHAHRLRRLSLGSITRWKEVSEAREHARALLRRLETDAIDPAVGGNGSMQAVWDRYVQGLKDGSTRRRMKGHPASEKTITAAQSAWKTHFETSIGSRTPKEITGAVIRDLHSKITAPRTVPVDGRGSRKRGGLYIANRALAYLQASWRASATDGLTAGIADPFTGLTRNHEKVRSEYLKKGDLPAFLKAVEAEEEPFRSYWKLMLFLGNRGGELRSLRWDDVNLDQSLAVFRDTKNHTDHEVPLPPDAVTLLNTLPRVGRLVFPFTTPKSSWARILKKSGLKNLRPHDVRRSVGTWLGAAGLSSKQVGALLGHKSDITSKVYMSLAEDVETKAAAVATQAELLKKFGGNVIAFPSPSKPKGKGKAKVRRKA